MKNKDIRCNLQQAEYLLEYDRRKIRECAEVFRNLAGVFGQKTEENLFGEEKPDRRLPDDGRRSTLDERKAFDSRKSFAEQMGQLASFLQDVSTENIRMVRLGGQQERQIIRAMAGEGILMSDIYIIRGKGGGMELSVTASVKGAKSVTVQDIAGYLSVLMDLRLAPKKRNPFFVGEEMETLFFEEEPCFEIMTGAATAVREGERVSGDNYSVLEQDGEVTLLLSDGVGSGEQAAEDSMQVIELAEQVLEAGLPGEMTVKMLNSMMRAQGREERMATLDMCRIDLRSGEAQFVKAGGICSFIKRGTVAEPVGEIALPLGFADEGQIMGDERRLESGDMVVLLSDGVLQEWEGTECMGKLQVLIGQWDCSTPQELANRILHYAIARSRGQIRDDMTVLVLGIWKTDGEKDGL